MNPISTEAAPAVVLLCRSSTVVEQPGGAQQALHRVHKQEVGGLGHGPALGAQVVAQRVEEGGVKLGVGADFDGEGRALLGHLQLLAALGPQEVQAPGATGDQGGAVVFTRLGEEGGRERVVDEKAWKRPEDPPCVHLTCRTMCLLSHLYNHVFASTPGVPLAPGEGHGRGVEGHLFVGRVLTQRVLGRTTGSGEG